MTLTFILIVQTFILAMMTKVYMEVCDIRNEIATKEVWDKLMCSTHRLEQTAVTAKQLEAFEKHIETIKKEFEAKNKEQ